MTRPRAIAAAVGILGVVVVVVGSASGRPSSVAEVSLPAPPAPADIRGGRTPTVGPVDGGTPAPGRAPGATVSRRPAAPPSPAAGSLGSDPAPPAGQIIDAYVTAYTWYDNDPAGAQIADPVLHASAGGTGTFTDPITLAVADGAFPPGTRFYLPHVRRYFIVEDTCAACGQRPTWVDMWIDGRSGSPSQVQACAEQLTGDHPIEIDPPAGRPVDPGALFSGSRCHART